MRHDLPLSRKQIASVVESQHRINAWEGSVRSGKTVASLLRWLGYVANAPRGGELVMVGRTRDSINRNVFAVLTNPDLFGALAKQVHYTNGAATAVIMGRLVHVLGANDAQAEPKVRGMTCAGAYVDEATTLPRAFFDQLVARCSVKGAQIFCTTNPDNPSHWFRKEYLLRPAETRLRSWHFTLDDNPFLDPEYVAALKATYQGLFYKRNILGQWVQAEGAIYDMWQPDTMVVDLLPHMTRWLAVGIDYGTANPFAGLLLGMGTDRRLYVASEYRHDSRLAHRQLTDAQYSQAVQQWLREREAQPEWLFVDPSAASFMTQLWADGVLGVAKANNDVLDGIRSVGVAIGSGRLRVHRSCTGLLDELPAYAWDDKAAAAGEDKPIKANDHSLDALRYGLHSTAHEWRGLIHTNLEAAA
ncbi:PBSX family phage terminase large subunit [Kitasatospora sp. CM 4170]|uniref:PBSX family phage terminase large subunit n=1 Tax=Kitasatospora aburaviensis TaxID=67265 RepID=A0ABW1ESF5_9ACTN|nr:PBSX family phage terminase large subunit [Kitasatospora sp. CM 4170]WNM45610.1 PBSX family phage terminase large subunit [Kitasatospora sp. CM 4170]